MVQATRNQKKCRMILGLYSLELTKTSKNRMVQLDPSDFPLAFKNALASVVKQANTTFHVILPNKS